MKKIYFFKIIFLLFYVSFLLTNANATDVKNDVRILVMQQLPYGYISDEGQKTGILYEILDRIVKASDMTMPINIMPTKRLVSTMLDNEKVCSIFVNSPDTAPFDIIEPIGYQVTVGILPASGIKLDDYSNLQGIIIAVPLGIIFDEKFHNDTSLNKVRPLHYINAVKMLKLGRIDAIAGAIPILKFLAKQQGMSLSTFDKPLVMLRGEMYLFCTKSVHKKVRDKMKEALIRLKDKGEIQKLLDSYFEEEKIDL